MELREGKATVKRELSGLGTDPERIADYLSADRISPPAWRTAAKFVSECMSSVSVMHVHFQNKFADRGFELRDLQWDQFDVFNASAARLTDDTYRIQIAIEAPPALLSLAHELSGNEPWEPEPASWWTRAWQKLTASIRRTAPDSSFTVWLVGVSGLADICDSALEWAMDAVRLLYYHEVSHLTLGHVGLSQTTAQETRALEFDADFNAGSLFAAWLIEDGIPLDDAYARLIHAALLLSTAFKALDEPSAYYHFPTVRLIAYVTGGVHAFEQNPDGADAATPPQWMAIALQLRDAYATRLSISSLGYLAGKSEDLEKDMEALETETIPTRERLKDDVLKKHYVLSSPVIHRN